MLYFVLFNFINVDRNCAAGSKIILILFSYLVSIIKPPLAIARSASCNGHVHLFFCLFVCLSVCLSVAKIQKRDFKKN